ncbi:MAG: hypothetical protein JST83_16840, partial [Bacteroidetes bacterium]|nr:hypothetical protein [Bacteroidota bacterium]
MSLLEVNIIDPKAGKLLRDLAEMNLIAIKEIPENRFSILAAKTSAKATGKKLYMDEINKEVNAVRSKRYG